MISLFSRFRKQPAPTSAQHAVTVIFDIADIDMESGGYEDSDLSELEDQLTKALADANAGEFWENEFCLDTVLSTYTGPDAERMLQALHPVLQCSPLGRKARLTFDKDSTAAIQRGGK